MLIRRGGLTQEEIAALAGVDPKTIERLDGVAKRGKRGHRPSRKHAMDLADAVGWDVNEALALLDYDPLTAIEREFLDTTGLRARLDTLWPRLTREQRRALVTLAATVVFKHAPSSTPDPRPTGHPGLQITPGAGEVPLPNQRNDNDGSHDDV